MPDILTTAPQDDTVAKQIRDLLITARTEDVARRGSLERIVEQLDTAAVVKPEPHQITELAGSGNIRGIDYMPAESLLFDQLKTSAGSADMVVDGSSTAVQFFYAPPPGKIALISRLIWDVVDGSMQVGRFGGLGALSNGLKVELLDHNDNVILDFLAGMTIKTNYEWSHLAGSDALIQLAAGDDEMHVRWSIFKTGAHLYLPPNRKIAMTVQDALAGLTHFESVVQGILVDV